MDSKVKSEYKVMMEFNGQSVPLVPFVEDVVRNVVLGLSEPMRGYEPGTEIKIILKPEK